MARSIFIALLLFALLTGCMIGPRYYRPSLPVQREWTEIIEPEGQEDPKWWRHFEDETLNHLIDYAYCQNKDLEISGVRVEQAYANLAISIGLFFPQFQQLQASRSYSDLSKATANIPARTSFQNYNFLIKASWELDLWGKYRHGIRAAQSDLCASLYTYRDVLRSLIGTIAQVYVQICGFNEKIALLKQNVLIQEQTVKIVKTKQELGQTSSLDLEQALSVLEQTRATLESQILQRELAANFLCTLLGVAPFAIECVYAFSAHVPDKLNIPHIGIPCDIIRSRPDVRAAEEAAIAQTHLVGVAETELLPSFSLSGFFGWEAENRKNLFRAVSKTYSYSTDVAWNIFNYGRISGNVCLQNALLQELLVNYQRTVINACREVEDAIISYMQFKKVAWHLKKAVQATSRSLELSMVQYKYGAVEFLNVLTAQNNLVLQQLSYVDAKVDQINSYISIQTSLGRGWQWSENEKTVSPCTKKEMRSRLTFPCMSQLCF